MIKVQEALKAAIELIQNCDIHTGNLLDIATTLDQCKAALAEIEKCYGGTSPVSEPRDWVGLSDDGIVKIIDETNFDAENFCILEASINYCRAIESALKQINMKG